MRINFFQLTSRQQTSRQDKVKSSLPLKQGKSPKGGMGYSETGEVPRRGGGVRCIANLPDGHPGLEPGTKKGRFASSWRCQNRTLIIGDFKELIYLCEKNDIDMEQLVVTISDSRLLPILEKAIGLLKGVTSVQVMPKKETVTDDSLSDIPSAVKDLIGAASGFTEEEMEEDPRLSYLLRK